MNNVYLLIKENDVDVMRYDDRNKRVVVVMTMKHTKYKADM